MPTLAYGFVHQDGGRYADVQRVGDAEHGGDEDLDAAYEYILDNCDILYEDALDRFYDSYYEHFAEVFDDEGR